MNKGSLFPLHHTRPLPGLNPFEIYRRLATPGAESFLLESGKGTPDIARYSFIGTDPYLSFTCKGSTIEIAGPSGTHVSHGDPWLELRSIFSRIGYPNRTPLPPFFGGAVGYFSYDFVHHFEDLPRVAADDLQLPDMHLIFVDSVVAIDHVEQQLHLIFAPPKDRCTMESYDSLCAEWNGKLADLDNRLNTPPPPMKDVPETPPTLTSTLSKETYMQRVRQCQEYIAAGDIYQANLSQRFVADLAGYEPQTLYQRLREVNPSPFGAFIEFDEVTIASVSPERLVRLQDRVAETRPLAGTRQRGKTTDDDSRLTDELLADPKEQAEHVMLVDLERNDIGRVCRYGTVQTNEFMAVEQCSHVNHIVSTVQGELAESRDAFDLIQAMFPGGTITGAPKIRCMEILDELEPTTRGPYTGSLGYLSLSGDLDLNILIRSVIVKGTSGYIQVGAGIVADSIPEREYEETLLKAEALFAAMRG
ncbi:MAG TPA: anthranilate synthase component I family protein [Nitrospirales bacterium]|nr:anthranilate synthase component I family protein [Nitrospirales bacterium]HIN32994.1 anthranilate synthase component I family protein [Nitrospirales bacterium]